MRQVGPVAARVALVTGGSRGIGRACAMALARDGCDVAVNFRRDADAAQDCVGRIEAMGRRALAYRASVDAAEQDEALVSSVLDDFGTVDILVHAAGVASRGRSVADTDPSEMERVLRTHAIGPFLLTKLLLPYLREQPRSAVIFISSVATTVYRGNGSPYNQSRRHRRGDPRS